MTTRIATAVLSAFASLTAHAICFPSSKQEPVNDSASGGFLERITKKKPLFDAKSGGYTAAPHIAPDGRIYVVPSLEQSASLVELNAGGQVKSWDFEGGAIVGSPVDLPGNRIGVLTTSAQFIGIDKESGQIAFTKEYTGGFTGSGVLTKLKDGRQVVLAAGADGDLVGLDPRSGEKVSSVELKARLTGTPVVADGYVGATSASGIFSWGNDASDAASFKSIKTLGSVQSAASYANKHFYFGTALGRIYAVPALGGSPVERDLGKVNGEQVSMMSKPLVLDGGRTILIADTAGRLHFFGPELEQLAPSVNLDVRIDADMALSPDGRFVAIPSSDGTLLVYDVQSGNLTKAAGYGPMATPAFGKDGTLYIADNAGDVNVLKINSAKAKPAIACANGTTTRGSSETGSSNHLPES